MSNNSKAETIHPRVGDIFEIRLPNDQFAYGKVFRDASVGIYEKIFSSRAELPINSSFGFIVGLYGDVLRSGIWPIVSHQPFGAVEEEWPPPACVKDIISGDYSIYHKGEIRISTESECVGLERPLCGTQNMLSIELWAEPSIFNSFRVSQPAEQALGADSPVSSLYQ